MNKIWFGAGVGVALVMLALLAGPVMAQDVPPETNVSIGSAFVDAAINGVPLALLPFGLVAFLKKQGVQGQALLFSSLGIGLVLGVGYMVYQTRPPVGDWWTIYGYWFGNVIYGLGLGLLASGVYEGVRAGVASALRASAAWIPRG